ncbi:unnamed protein product [Protopolystoma xenopodis]|uniref:Uncharacterized protein n=1 Tax=Protopolystoma xenopodis TaxID=117903 RepID=A0A3S5AFF3_9PLAT|nr:unnamed protein product [Protopolystoma xenopodis]
MKPPSGGETDIVSPVVFSPAGPSFSHDIRLYSLRAKAAMAAMALHRETERQTDRQTDKKKEREREQYTTGKRTWPEGCALSKWAESGNSCGYD